MKMLSFVLALLTPQLVFAERHTATFSERSERNSKDSGDMTEAEFNRVIDSVAKLYDLDHSKFGMGKIVVKRDWNDDWINARAGMDRQAGTWSVEFFGGLARLPGITSDAYAIVACHEFSHLYGGAIFATGGTRGDALSLSSEANADYIAANTCLFNLWRSQRSKNAEARKTASSDRKYRIPLKICKESYSSESQQNICLRVSIAALAIAQNYLWMPGDGGRMPTFENKSTAKVNETIDYAYPSNQCRLDTFLFGAECDKKTPRGVIPGWDIYPEPDMKKDSESRKKESIAMKKHSCDNPRPRCWWAGDDSMGKGR